MESGLVAVEKLSVKTNDGRYLWRCACRRCGGEKIAPMNRAKKSKSCGCYVPKPRLTHGMKHSKEYNTWHGMKDRCLNPASKDYFRYGGSGITVYQKWIDSFEEFFLYIGKAPSEKHQIDRINTFGSYEPGNVRWASVIEQQRNRKNNYRWHIKGIVYDSISDAASANNVSLHTIHRWCDGSFDSRRGYFNKPRQDCWKEAKYGSGC